jgi:predicted Zn-ribbon and HTH transcriptional regulator
MNELFNYRCKSCGHAWTWAYVFVVRCPKCKQSGGDKEKAD